MSDELTPASTASSSEPACADRWWVEMFYLFLIYVVVTPLLAALLVWGFYRFMTVPSGFLNLEQNFKFWLAVAFLGGAPVLLLAAIAHFLARRRKPVAIFAAVLGTGVLGWTLMGIVLDPLKATQAVLMGLPLLGVAFVLANWLYFRVVHGAA